MTANEASRRMVFEPLNELKSSLRALKGRLGRLVDAPTIVKLKSHCPLLPGDTLREDLPSGRRSRTVLVRSS